MTYPADVDLWASVGGPRCPRGPSGCIAVDGTRERTDPSQPVRARISFTACDLLILVDEAAEAVASLDLVELGRMAGEWW
jgi:hypothetical protein